MRKKKGFTLIELIAVLVILAILALIVTPLVLNIIKKARTAADKRSIDAYGRSIELAIADYLLDKGSFPTSIDQLTIEYTGDKVECETTKLNSDSSVYLAGCTVGGRSVSGYTYGKDSEQGSDASNYKAYEIGQTIEYNGVNYYVIKNSGTTEETVTMLKAEPLTYEEVQTYSAGTGAQTYDNNGIGLMQYHSESSNYEISYIKTTVDAWKADKASGATEARLITLDDLTDNLGMELNKTNPTSYQINVTEDTPTWVMGENYSYWTMTTNTDKTADVWIVGNRSYATVDSNGVQDNYYAVRPVITLLKSEL